MEMGLSLPMDYKKINKTKFFFKPCKSLNHKVTKICLVKSEINKLVYKEEKSKDFLFCELF